MLFNNITANELLNIIDSEKAFQTAHRDTNTAKKLQALNLVEQFLLGLDKQKFSKLESVKNTGKYVRDFEMFNLGTAVELILKAYAHKRNYVVKSYAAGYDMIIDGVRYEVKASLSGTSKNTPLQKCKHVLLVNAKGVWLIDSDTAVASVDKYGRFSPNAEIGEYFDELAELLGY